MTSLSVSVIIPVHNGGAAFRACLDALSRSRRSPDEVIVVADGDTDGSRDVARRWGARVLVNGAPSGPAAARNRGARAAGGDLLFFIDADVTVNPGTVGRAVAAFEAQPDLDALIGSYDDEPAAPGFLSQYRNLLHHFTHQRAHEDASTFWGACGAIRRTAFWAVDGFDERHRRPSIEDIELGYRLKAAGYRLRLDRDLHVKHLKRWTARSMITTDVFQRGVPWTRLILGSGRVPSDLSIDWRSRLSVAAVGVLAGALIAGARHPRLLAAAPPLAAAFLVLNQPFYRFLAEKRGTRFALRAVPWHALYHAYSGAAFGLGLAQHTARRLTS